MVIIDLVQYSQKKKGADKMCDILKKIKNKDPYELLREYGIPFTPPIDVAELIKKIGISTISFDFSDVEDALKVSRGQILGAAFSNGNNLAIFYKKDDSFHRKKFTIAHELAHCCLHCANNEAYHYEFRQEPFESDLSETELEKEREANIFAGKLLIPKETLMKNYDKLIVPSLTSLAQIFDVSASVMAARLDYLNLPYFKDSKTEVMI